MLMFQWLLAFHCQADDTSCDEDNKCLPGSSVFDAVDGDFIVVMGA